MLARRPLGLLAIVVVVAAVVAAPVYYFQILGPQRRGAGQRAEARTWVAAWRAARDCAAGRGPGGDPAERVLLREVATGPGIAASCRGQLMALEEAQIGATGKPVLDRIWRRVNQGTRTFVTRARTFASDLHPAEKKRSGLAEILAEVDRLATELARAARIDPPAPLALSELPPLPDGLLLHDTRGLPAQLIWWIPEGSDTGARRAAIQQLEGTLALTVAAPDGVELLVLRGPDDITHVPMPEGAAPAVGGAWAAVLGERGGLGIAALDPDGRPLPGGARQVARSQNGELLPPIYAFGGGSARAVVHARRGASTVAGVRVMASSDEGRTWTERWSEPPGMPPIMHASWIAPRAYFSYAAAEGNRWLPVTEGTLVTGLVAHPLPLASPFHSLCHSRSAVWLLAERVLHAPASGAEPPAPVPWSLPDGWQRFTCTADKLAVYVPGVRDATVTRCHLSQGCGSPWRLTAGGPLALHLGAGQGLLAASTVGDFLILWRLESGTYGRLSPVQIYRAPGIEVIALAEWDQVLHALVTHVETGDLHLVPIDRPEEPAP